VALDKLSGKVVGAGERLVDTYLGSNQGAAWSPDGKSIAYLSHRNQPMDQRPDTLVVRSLDTGKEKLTPATFTALAKPMWFPDSLNILVGGRNSEGLASFYKADLKTGEFSEVINTRTVTIPVMQLPALSPDGKIVYTAPIGPNEKPGILGTFDLSTSRRTDINTPAMPGDSIIAIASSTITGKIAFLTIHNQPGGTGTPWHLYVANRDGSDARDLVPGLAPPFAYNLAWAPDERFIYFIRPSGQDSPQLWRVATSGGTPEYTGFSAKNLGGIDISRDGTWLLYSAGETPRTEYWALDNLLSTKAAR
jgi:Tol biopolymer transport system component